MSDTEGTLDKPYVENPYTALLKEAHWPSVQPTSFSVGWSARLVNTPDGHPYPYYAPGYALMDVSVGGLPELRSSLKVGTIFVSGIPQTIWNDQVSDTFADGTSGTITAGYFMGLGPVPLGGSVSYSTTARREQFFGAHSVTISLLITLNEVEGGTGYTWTAHATSVGTQNLAGTASSGGSITLNATLVLHPLSLSFSEG